jgi:hypothetical protein
VNEVRASDLAGAHTRHRITSEGGPVNKTEGEAWTAAEILRSAAAQVRSRGYQTEHSRVGPGDWQTAPVDVLGALRAAALGRPDALLPPATSRESWVLADAHRALLDQAGLTDPADRTAKRLLLWAKDQTGDRIAELLEAAAEAAR